jgi:light-harvesting complex 1 beta chain
MPEQPVEYLDRDRISLSGLTRQEAAEFNRFFLTSFLVFTAIAIVAHALVWAWRPWAQSGAPVNTSMIDAVRPLLSMLG